MVRTEFAEEMVHDSDKIAFDLCQPYAVDEKKHPFEVMPGDDWSGYTRAVADESEQANLKAALPGLDSHLAVGIQNEFATDGTLHGGESLYN